MKCLSVTSAKNGRNYDRADFKQCISFSDGLRPQESYIALGFVLLYIKGFMCIIRFAF